jgi:hypothetical protein
MKDVRAGLSIVGALVASLALTAGAEARDAALGDADAPAAQLERVDEAALGPGAVTRYGQEVAGVPVAGAGVVVADAPGEPAEVLFDESVSGLEAPGTPTVGRSEAVQAALSAIGNPGGGEVRAELVIDAEHGNQLVWQVTHSDFRPISDRRVTVSATDGSVIENVDLLRQATGDAQLFEPNAVVENDGYGGLQDRDDRDYAALTNLRSPVPLQDLLEGQSCLKGEWANVRFTPQSKRVCRDDLDWSNITRASNRFEALMAYYHVTEMQQYIQSLDLDVDVNEESQKVIANTFPDDNSFYSPSADEIQLGTGGVDDGEDGDVIIHEYGHAVHDAQNPLAFGGSSNQTNAMGEGFGDYLAAVHQNELVGPDPEWTPCIMEWDARSYDTQSDPPSGICLRRADDPSTRANQTNQCEGAFNFHCVGQVWSSSLLSLRDELGEHVGNNVMDTLVLASHEFLGPDPNFKEAAEAIAAADTIIYGGTHCAQIDAEFTARGFEPDIDCV